MMVQHQRKEPAHWAPRITFLSAGLGAALLTLGVAAVFTRVSSDRLSAELARVLKAVDLQAEACVLIDGALAARGTPGELRRSQDVATAFVAAERAWHDAKLHELLPMTMQAAQASVWADARTGARFVTGVESTNVRLNPVATRAKALAFAARGPLLSTEARAKERADRLGIFGVALQSFLAVLAAGLLVGLVRESHRESERSRRELVQREALVERAQRDLENRLAAKSVFFANMTHELRTPLGGILGMSSLMREGSLSTHQARSLETIERSGQALLQIINDILDHAKIEQGKLVLERVPFSPRQEIEGVLTLLGSVAYAKQLELVLDCDPQTPEQVIGDPGRFRQILLNLVGNALKFTPSGEVVVTLGPMEHRGSSAIRFGVKDTGVGIAPDVIPRLFKPFEQADASTSRRFGGTGLGLSITHALVKMMGGQVWIESVVNVGTEFSVELPLAVSEGPRVEKSLQNLSFRCHLRNPSMQIAVERELAAAGGRILREESIRGQELTDPSARIPDVIIIDDDALETFPAARALVSRLVVLARPAEVERCMADSRFSAIVISRPVQRGDLLSACRGHAGQVENPVRNSAGLNADSAPPSESPQFIEGRPEILLAEDNLVNQRVLTALLTRLGCAVSLANNGRVAVSEATRRTWDLVLMDMEMPELSGTEAARAIRRFERQANRQAQRIVALTANVSREDRDRCARAGMDGFLEKPATLDSLRKMLQENLQKLPVA